MNSKYDQKFLFCPQILSHVFLVLSQMHQEAKRRRCCHESQTLITNKSLETKHAEQSRLRDLFRLRRMNKQTYHLILHIQEHKNLTNLINTFQSPFINSTKASLSHKTFCPEIFSCRCQFTKCKSLRSYVIYSFIFSDLLNFQGRIYLQFFWKQIKKCMQS